MSNTSWYSCFRLRHLMRAVWWWGRQRWSLSHILKKLITAIHPCVVYCVSSNRKFPVNCFILCIFLFHISHIPWQCALDGDTGSGKTMSLCHALHYCYTQGWLILHIPDGELHSLNQNARWCEVWSLMMLWCSLCSSSVGQEL